MKDWAKVCPIPIHGIVIANDSILGIPIFV